MVIERAMSLYDTFASFFDELINDSIEVVGLFIGCKLAVSTGAFLEDAVGIFDFLAATKFVDDVTQEPFDQFADQVTGRKLFLFTEIDELAIQTVAHSSPFVLFDKIHGVDTEGHIIAAQLPELGDNGLEKCSHANCFIDTRTDIANAKFQSRVG